MAEALNSPLPTRIAIINRSFWPVYPVIGEALLRLAEELVSEGHTVSVVLRDSANIRAALNRTGRGKRIFFYRSRAWSTSASSVTTRIIDSIFFSVWVIWSLTKIRPKKVYVSTDPPIIVPFIVMLYAKLFRIKFIYHLQDIHPEATNAVKPLPKLFLSMLVKIDSLTMRKAETIVTITHNMAEIILLRSQTNAPVHVLINPSISFSNIDSSKGRDRGFAFCGNIGRLQRIPLILNSIEEYFNRGGRLRFVFAGAGVYANEVKKFADRYDLFEYRGFVDPVSAAQINADFSWALLPIEDEVTNYAFPSKASSYLVSGAKILAVCSNNTSVATWINRFEAGIVVAPEKNELVEAFFQIENKSIAFEPDNKLRLDLARGLSIDHFVLELKEVMLR